MQVTRQGNRAAGAGREPSAGRRRGVGGLRACLPVCLAAQASVIAGIADRIPPSFLSGLSRLPVSVLLLRQFPQFADWPDAPLQVLSERLELRRLTRRQVVLTGQDVGATLAWVIEGAIWLVDHSLDDRECVLGRYGPGEMLGELHAFGGSRSLPEGLGYMAAAAASIAVVSKEVLSELIAANPLIAQGIIRLMAERSCAHFRWRAILALPSAVERVIAVLEVLTGGETPLRTLPAGITQQEIAAYANTTRETVTRTMQRLQASGAVMREGSSWQINVEALARAREDVTPN